MRHEYSPKRFHNDPQFQDLLNWLKTVDTKKPSTYDYELEQRIRAMFSAMADDIIKDERDSINYSHFNWGYTNGYRNGYEFGVDLGRKDGVSKKIIAHRNRKRKKKN